MTTLLAHIANLQEAEQEILAYFGYEHDWRVFPFDFNLDMHWAIRGDEILYAETPIPEALFTENYYSGEMYRRGQVLRGPEFTMVVVNTRTDGNIFLMVFDNKLEYKG